MNFMQPFGNFFPISDAKADRLAANASESPLHKTVQKVVDQNAKML